MQSPSRYLQTPVGNSLLVLFYIFLYYKEFSFLSNHGVKTESTFNLFADAAEGKLSNTLNDENSTLFRSNLSSTEDHVEDSLFHTISSTMDPSSSPQSGKVDEVITNLIDVTALYGGEDPSSYGDDEVESNIEQKEKETRSFPVDKHWGKDEAILRMRDKLRYGHLLNRSGSQVTTEMTQNRFDDPNTEIDGENHADIFDPHDYKRPPVFLLPGLASTRLVSWKNKACSNPLLSPIKALEYVWMNINLLLQATIDSSCFAECMTLGKNQADMDDENVGCKLRADEGLDAISSLAPGSIGSSLFVGGTNTVYAWLIQWLSDNLGLYSNKSHCHRRYSAFLNHFYSSSICFPRRIRFFKHSRPPLRLAIESRHNAKARWVSYSYEKTH